MKKDSLGKLYDRLTPHERFRLVVEAQARGDEVERRRLVESCPRKTYEMDDVAFQDRVRAGEEMVMVLCLDLSPRLAKMRILEAFHVGLPYIRVTCLDAAHAAYFDGQRAGMRLAWEAAGMEGDPPELDEGDEDRQAAIKYALGEITARVEKDSDMFIASLTELKAHLAGETRAIWEGFSSFSRIELGMEPKNLVKVWFEPALEGIEGLEAVMNDVELDQAKAEEYARSVSDLWRRLTET